MTNLKGLAFEKTWVLHLPQFCTAAMHPFVLKMLSL